MLNTKGIHKRGWLIQACFWLEWVRISTAFVLD